MLDQLFELSRKAIESSLEMQQVMFKQWTQNWLSTTPAAVGISSDWGGTTRRRWVELTVDALNKQRETVDATYKMAIQAIEKLARVSDAKSAEEWVRAVEEVWGKLFEGFKCQAESQFRDFQAWAAKSFEMARKAETT
jgi:hypothetical protein